MEYTVKKLAHMAGVSTRTLRYYDEIGVLKPARINSWDIEFMDPKKLIDYSKFFFIES